jgi:hypothetical protein
VAAVDVELVGEDAEAHFVALLVARVHRPVLADPVLVKNSVRPTSLELTPPLSAA